MDPNFLLTFSFPVSWFFFFNKCYLYKYLKSERSKINNSYTQISKTKLIGLHTLLALLFQKQKTLRNHVRAIYIFNGLWEISRFIHFLEKSAKGDKESRLTTHKRNHTPYNRDTIIYIHYKKSALWQHVKSAANVVKKNAEKRPNASEAFLLLQNP